MRYATEQNLTELALERWSDCKSKRMRHIKVKPGAPINSKALGALIQQAYDDVKARL